MSRGRGGSGTGGGAQDRSGAVTPVGDLVEELLRRRQLARGAPAGKLHREWAAVVGPRLAAVSAPLRLEHGSLVVAVDTGPWGAQVGFLAEDVRRRANEVLGRDVVTRVQVVVDAARTRPATPPAERPPEPSGQPREPLGRNDSEG